MWTLSRRLHRYVYAKLNTDDKVIVDKYYSTTIQYQEGGG